MDYKTAKNWRFYVKINKMRIVLVFLLVCCIFFITWSVTTADEFSSINFKVLDPVIKPGAGFATSSGFKLWSSLGQEGIGLSSGVTFGLKSGFLYFPAPSVVTTSTPTPSPTPLSAGFFSGLLTEFLKKPRPPELPEGGLICDFNEDNGCNLIDLSIMLFYYGDRTNEETVRFDLSGNGIVDFPDVSILFYYWTD